MSAGTQVTLEDSVREASSEISAEEWRDQYQQYNGSIADIARAVGRCENTVRKHLAELQIHEIESPAPHRLVDKLPQDVGLSPLGCGRCGEENIVNHPCPSCGYDPREGDSVGGAD